MRLAFLLLLFVVVLFVSGFWYQVFDPVCKDPVTYRIGEVDERFGTSEAELRRIAVNAEHIWENQLNQQLFVYAEDGKLPINLVFDERQENAELEEQLRQDLDAKEGMSESVAQEYEKLITEFRSLKKSYESQVLSYEARLKKYNTAVTKWNNQGGVPPKEMEELTKESEALRALQDELESKAVNLNKIVDQLNHIGAEGNSLITDYNEVVQEYNTRFSQIHEYTQGDHSVEEINVYQFNTEEELTLVLAHEFGHALWLSHVENEESIMYRLMGDQNTERGLTAEDIVEFERVCIKGGLLQSLYSLFQNAF